MGIAKTYAFQGREITVQEAARLAGRDIKTIYARLKANDNDMEMAILGGGAKN